jgi:hypothetical protein
LTKPPSFLVSDWRVLRAEWLDMQKKMSMTETGRLLQVFLKPVEFPPLPQMENYSIVETYSKKNHGFQPF